MRSDVGNYRVLSKSLYIGMGKGIDNNGDKENDYENLRPNEIVMKVSTVM